MDHLARGRLVEPGAGIVDPVGKAIAAKASQAHQIDVLRIMPMAQVPDETAEGSSGHGIGKFIESIAGCHFCIRIHWVRPWVFKVGRP